MVNIRKVLSIVPRIFLVLLFLGACFYNVNCLGEEEDVFKTVEIFLSKFQKARHSVVFLCNPKNGKCKLIPPLILFNYYFKKLFFNQALSFLQESLPWASS